MEAGLLSGSLGILWVVWLVVLKLLSVIQQDMQGREPQDIAQKGAWTTVTN